MTKEFCVFVVVVVAAAAAAVTMLKRTHTHTHTLFLIVCVGREGACGPSSRYFNITGSQDLLL